MRKSAGIGLLISPDDREELQALLAQLNRRGLRVSERNDAAGKDDVVLAVLSEAFYKDKDLTDRLLGLIGAGADKVLPLQLDDAPIPEQLKNALYARNIIPAAGRDASLIAERIVSALPRKKSRLPLVLAAAGLVLVALVGFLIWRSAADGEKLPAMAGEGPIVVPSALGITEEDLASIENVVIVGEQIAFFQNYEIKGFTTNSDIPFIPDDAFQSWDHFAYLDEWNDVHWYSKETGQELSSARWDDLRFIGLMPNLRSLTMVLVDTDESALPELRGAEKLERVDIESCGFESIDWIAGSSAQEITIRFTPVRDFGALTACGKLKRFSVDMYDQAVETGFTDFSPPLLENLWLWHANSGGALDLSSLRGCGELFDVTLGDLPLKDLSCLEKAEKLSMLRLSDMNGLTSLKGIEGLPVSWLEITNCSSLREIRAVGELKGLCSLYIESCGKLRDFSPAAGCSQLEQFHVWGMHGQVRDLSFLAGLDHLQRLQLYDVDLPNTNFLSGFSDKRNFILEFSGDIRDYSGLRYVKDYDYLHVNPHDGDLDAVLPYLEEATVRHLHLHECRGVDLSRLPEVTESLEIWYGDLRDLSAMPALKIRDLELYDLQYLSSLDGIQNLPLFADGSRDTILRVTGCPRLTDWSAIEGIHLDGLTLDHVYTLPDLAGVDFNTLKIEGAEELTDLGFLNSKPDDWHYHWICLIEQNDLDNLSALRRLKGERLTVDPALAEQAEELVEQGRVAEYSIEYPDGSFRPFEGNVTLLSLDELDTLPASMLSRVGRLCLVGDRLVDLDEYDVGWRWEDGKDRPVITLFDHSSGEESVLEYGAGSLTDLGLFAPLSGLNELRLFSQPIEDLDGIQKLSELRSLCLFDCPEVKDVSAAFACQQIRYLCVDGCPITSIEGVQNLSGLVDLNLNGTQVKDLSPLSGCDLSEAIEERGGLALYISEVPIEDYAPLADLRALSNLDINNVDAARCVPYLKDTPILRFSACGSFTEESASEDVNALFADFVRAHPGLQELWIPWNRGIRDLSPLLELEELRYVRVSTDMKAAIASLDGTDRHFDFEIEGQ